MTYCRVFTVFHPSPKPTATLLLWYTALVKRERGTGGLIKIKNCRYWYAQFYERGRQRRVSTKTVVKQKAQSFLRKLLVDKERGVIFDGRQKYEDLRAALLINYQERGNKSLEVLTDGTETIWGLKAVDTFFRGYPVGRITTDAAREFAQQLLKSGASNGTVNKSLALLRRMLSIAHEDGKIQFPPKIRLLKPGAARKGFLPRDQFDKVLAGLPANLKPLITFLYFCGVRVGEALQIEWAQVDLPAGLIRLEGEQTKNAEPRTVPLPDVLVGMLEMVDDKSGKVFDGTNLRKCWWHACVGAELGTLTKIEGKRDPRYTGLIIHDLRRSAIRNLIKAGVNEKVAMTISGHKTRSVFDRYHIVDTDDVVEAMRRVQNSAKQVKIVKTPRLKNT
jgi:integrase